MDIQESRHRTVVQFTKVLAIINNMNSLTQQEIISTIKELQESLIAELEISQKETNIKLAKIKAHTRTILAKEAVRSINLN